jgi:hypothetical protein
MINLSFDDGKMFYRKMKLIKEAYVKSIYKILGIAVLTAVILTGCPTISGENRGNFESITVPAKDFTSLGLIFTENVVEDNRGKVFTYNELLKKAKELGADAIVNVVIDVQYEGTKLMSFFLNRKETWYGSAMAIKYTPGTLNEVTTSYTGNTTITKEGVIMGKSGGGGSGGSGGSQGKSSEKKWYNPFTWFK